MVLPTKHLHPGRSMLVVGGEVLGLLDRPRTVSSLWERMQERRTRFGETDITFDWFVLTLDFLFVVKAITFEKNRVQRRPT